MSGLIVVCERGTAAPRQSVGATTRLARHVLPDDISAAPPIVQTSPGLTLAVMNPVGASIVRPGGACLGVLFEQIGWERPGTPRPDGTYAIVRHDDAFVELVTDVFASRTIWYVLTDQFFLASTSQRALVALLGSFEPCPETVTWLLAAGNLGPDHGWDRRLRRVPARSRLVLDRRAWTLTLRGDEVRYEAGGLRDEEQLAALWEGIFSVAATLPTDGAALTLSGGCDSRSILVALADAGRTIRCVTWGLAASAADPANDAAIARRLAQRFGMPHDYLLLDFGEVAPRQIFSRFLLAGEGRIEDFSGYTDGFRAWRRLLDEGVELIVRGDCPGWGSPYAPISQYVARSINMHCTLVADYPESELIHRLGLAVQRRPEEFFQREGELLDDYRDRLYNDYELPTCMAAMNEVKCAYLEVVNPLYGRAVVDAATALPIHLRHCRQGFERLAGTLVRDIPFSDHQADEAPSRFLRRPEMHEELLAELSSAAARRVLSAAACDELVTALERPLSDARSSLRSGAKGIVPKRVLRALRPEPRPHLAVSRLAHRAYLASRMASILHDDARFLDGPTVPFALQGSADAGGPTGCERQVP